MMIITIEKNKVFSHIVGKEYKEDYDTNIRYAERLADEKIQDIFREYQETWGNDYEYEDDIYNRVKGEYTLENGDFVYTITIK